MINSLNLLRHKCTHDQNPYVYNINGRWQAMCLNCHLEGPFGESITEAVWAFSEQIKEKPMTSEYRRGVEDALKNFAVAEVVGMMIPTSTNFTGPQFIADAFAALSEKRRKTLLTKKVTKWANVYRRVAGDFIIGEGLYNTEEDASYNKANGYMKTWVKMVPIEIEVPID